MAQTLVVTRPRPGVMHVMVMMVRMGKSVSFMGHVHSNASHLHLVHRVRTWGIIHRRRLFDNIRVRRLFAPAVLLLRANFKLRGVE